MPKKQQKKEAKNKKVTREQLEFDFSPMYFIQWHSINEDPNLKNKKGYKTRTKIIKSIVDDFPLFFKDVKEAQSYINDILVSQFFSHETSKRIREKINFVSMEERDSIASNFNDNGLTMLNSTTFTFRIYGSYIKYWIEIK